MTLECLSDDMSNEGLNEFNCSSLEKKKKQRESCASSSRAHPYYTDCSICMFLLWESLKKVLGAGWRKDKTRHTTKHSSEQSFCPYGHHSNMPPPSFWKVNKKHSHMVVVIPLVCTFTSRRKVYQR